MCLRCSFLGGSWRFYLVKCGWLYLGISLLFSILLLMTVLTIRHELVELQLARARLRIDLLTDLQRSKMTFSTIRLKIGPSMRPSTMHFRSIRAEDVLVQGRSFVRRWKHSRTEKNLGSSFLEITNGNKMIFWRHGLLLPRDQIWQNSAF